MSIKAILIGIAASIFIAFFFGMILFVLVDDEYDINQKCDMSQCPSCPFHCEFSKHKRGKQYDKANK